MGFLNFLHFRVMHLYLPQPAIECVLAFHRWRRQTRDRRLHLQSCVTIMRLRAMRKVFTKWHIHWVLGQFESDTESSSDDEAVSTRVDSHDESGPSCDEPSSEAAVIDRVPQLFCCEVSVQRMRQLVQAWGRYTIETGTLRESFSSWSWETNPYLRSTQQMLMKWAFSIWESELAPSLMSSPEPTPPQSARVPDSDSAEEDFRNIVRNIK